jgi:uncharacterized membrane protein
VRRDRLLLATLVAIGALLRLREYLANRALWLDEAALALNVLEKSLADLVLRPLDSIQAAPPGFLLLVKLAVSAFGSSEHALRLVPLLFSLAALPLMAWVAVRALAPGAALVAVALFAVLEPLLRYAAEVKQYALDVTVGLGIVAATLPYLNGTARGRQAAMLALTGVIAVWLSHTAPFFLAAAGLALFLQHRKGRIAPATLAGIAAVWAASFAGVYLVSLRDLAAHEGFRQAWSGTFPSSPISPSAIPWLGKKIVGLFSYAFGTHSESVGAFTVLVGCASLLLARPALLVLLLGPMGAALAAGLLGRYPFQNRLVLFAVPLLALLAGAGTEHIRERTHGSRVVVVLLIVFLILHPAYLSLSQQVGPYSREDVRSVLTRIQEEYQADDVLYVYPFAQAAYRYYARRIDFQPQEVMLARRGQTWKALAEDMGELRGRGRVWVLLSHFSAGDEEVIRYHLDNLGTLRTTFSAQGAKAFLYELP